ncbi:DNA circularization protein [Desulfocurvibacter africanus]|uniref:DNA circulation family protein n=1 Tax=Desulfocurvibacter africanus subsp. africanus str. Walvis Bay TaxID=690850 RepID=F3YW24_DESAF|nr:DNA circularization N-terminal domain-containing protein [Desulfocurvibacter africanus]EGJ49054.1 DNA circulation family protein [Desulfocurvibacter africanus subsp. africanus str. Walvis Bay]
MAWRDELRPGSFRGVPFLIEAHDHPFGRRLAVREYPLREQPSVQDLGGKARRYSLELFVLGENYFTARDNLMAALEARGVGSLVHPYLGTMRVHVEEARLRESSHEGGKATFSATFVEAGEVARPDVTIDTASLVSTRADAASAAVASDFEERFSVEDQPAWVYEDSKTWLGQAVESIQEATDNVPGMPSELTQLQSDLYSLNSGLATLLTSPGGLAAQVQATIGSMAGLSMMPDSVLATYRSLFGFGGDSGSKSQAVTPSRAQLQENRDATGDLVRQTAVIEASRAAASWDYDSSADAQAVRDELADQLDLEAETAPDATYSALVDLRAALVRDLTDRAMLLPRLLAWTPARTLPALVIAHQIYGDATRAEQLVARNKLRHPLAVPGGQALEVLADG